MTDLYSLRDGKTSHRIVALALRNRDAALLGEGGTESGYITDRLIRQVDVAPTVAVLGGVRMPAQCEGAPIYQILVEEF